MCTGGGHATLQESLGYVGVPVMTKKSFISTERTIGEWWRERLQQSMIQPNSVLVNVTNSWLQPERRTGRERVMTSTRRVEEGNTNAVPIGHDGGIEPGCAKTFLLTT